MQIRPETISKTRSGYDGAGFLLPAS
jgi:hypothetical protein